MNKTARTIHGYILKNTTHLTFDPNLLPENFKWIMTVKKDGKPHDVYLPDTSIIRTYLKERGHPIKDKI